MVNNDNITFSLGKTEEEKEFELKEQETNKALRDAFNSINREDWIITDYGLALEMLESDFQIIGKTLYTFYWESGRRRKDAEKALDTIHNIINKETLMEKISESGIEKEFGEYGKRIDILIKGKIKKEDWTILDYSLMFDHLLFELYGIKSVLDMYDKSTKTMDDVEKFLWEIYEITHPRF